MCKKEGSRTWTKSTMKETLRAKEKHNMWLEKTTTRVCGVYKMGECACLGQWEQGCWTRLVRGMTECCWENTCERVKMGTKM